LGKINYGSHTGSQGFIFQQDGAPAHPARVTQDWLQVNCPGFIEKNHGPKLSRFKLSGPSRLQRLAGKVPLTPTNAQDD